MERRASWMVRPWGSKTDLLSVTLTRALGISLLDDAPRGERHRDPRRGQAVVDGFVDLAAGQALLRVVAGPEHQLEVYGEFAEARNRDLRLALGIGMRGLERGRAQELLHAGEVVAEGHAHLHARGQVARGPALVHQPLL